mmetsp:Transcript_7906/g.20586  ORF Transcript_7906/g.20586 Transcript_7906/m.20586 type:complete len:810 (-) Transcript_7906:656-3085(-)
MAVAGVTTPTKGLLPQLDHVITSVHDVSPDLSQYKKMRHRIRFPKPMRKYTVDAEEEEEEEEDVLQLDEKSTSEDSDSELNAAEMKRRKMKKEASSKNVLVSVMSESSGVEKERSHSRAKKKKIEKKGGLTHSSSHHPRRAASSTPPNTDMGGEEAFGRRAGDNGKSSALSKAEELLEKRRVRDEYLAQLANPVRKGAQTVDQLSAEQERARQRDIVVLKRKILELENLYNDLKHEVEAKENQLKKGEVEFQFLRTTDYYKEMDEEKASVRMNELSDELDRMQTKVNEAVDYAKMLRFLRNRLKKENRELEALVKNLQRIERQQNIELKDAIIALADFRQAQQQKEGELKAMREQCEQEEEKRQFELQQQQKEMDNLRKFREDLDERHRQRQKLLQDPEIKKERRLLMRSSQVQKQQNAVSVGSSAMLKKATATSNTEAAYHKLLKLCSASSTDEIIASVKDREVSRQRMQSEADTLRKKLNDLEEERKMLTTEKGESTGMSNAAITNLRNKKIDELSGMLMRATLKMKDSSVQCDDAEKLLLTCHEFLHQMIDRSNSALSMADSTYLPLRGGEGGGGKGGLVPPMSASQGGREGGDKEKGRGRASPNVPPVLEEEDEDDEEEGNMKDAAVQILEMKLTKVLDMMPAEAELPSSDMAVYDSQYYGHASAGAKQMMAQNMKSSFRYTVGASLQQRVLDVGGVMGGGMRSAESGIGEEKKSKPRGEVVYSVEAIQKQAREAPPLRRPSVVRDSTSTMSSDDEDSMQSGRGEDRMEDVLAARRDMKVASQSLVKKEMKKLRHIGKSKTLANF